MFPLIELKGGPRERGRQYGVQASAQIRHSIASYARLFAIRRGLDWQATQAVAEGFLPFLSDHAADLLEEMRGIAEGAGLEPAEIVALNVRTEILAGLGVRVFDEGAIAALERNRAAGVPRHADEAEWWDWRPAEAALPAPSECTMAAALPGASKGERSYLAQTWDWNGEQRAACVLLRIEAPGEPTVLTMTEAGLLAKIGVNSEGVGVCLNLLRSHSDGQAPGMPVHVALRQALQSSSYAEARAVVMRFAAGGSSCVTVAQAGVRAANLELTPNANAVIEDHEGLLAHSNHCLDPATCVDECPQDPMSTSLERLDRATVLLAGQRGRIDLAAMQALLRDHDGEPRCICRHPDAQLPPFGRSESVCGIIMELDRGVMHVAPDVPCQAEFEPISL